MVNESFPGSNLARRGMEDLAQGRDSISDLLVAIGAPRLRALGVPVPDPGFDAPEHRLYHKLWQKDPDSAHSQYNALVRRLVSFVSQALAKIQRGQTQDRADVERLIESGLVERVKLVG